MKCSTQTAVALGVGYLLGRKHRFRTAAAAAVVAGFGSTSVGDVLLRRGAKMLTSPAALGKVSPQLGDLADTVRGDLLEAGKAAVSAAVTNRIDSLTDSLRDQAERIRNPAETVTDAAETATGAARGATRTGTRAASGVSRRVRGRGTARTDEDERAEEAPLDEEAEEASRDEVVEHEDYEAEADEPYEDEDQEEPEERPVRRAAPRRRPAVTRSRR
jgi:hypothetical protein